MSQRFAPIAMTKADGQGQAAALTSRSRRSDDGRLRIYKEAARQAANDDKDIKEAARQTAGICIVIVIWASGGGDFCEHKKTARRLTGGFIGIRRRPTLPGRYQPSTIGAEGLNFCVRYGNRWDPFAIATGNCIVVKDSHPDNRTMFS